MDDIAERPEIPASVTEITTAWLNEALSELPILEGATVAAVTEIGSGYGLAGSAARVELRSQGRQPSAVVLKLARRKGGTAELAFYRDVAPQVPCRVPCCHGGWVDADPDADRAVLVLEALPVRSQGDVLTGATANQAYAVLDAAAAFHTAFAHDAPASLALLEYDSDDLRRRLSERTASFLRRYAETCRPPHEHGSTYYRTASTPFQRCWAPRLSHSSTRTSTWTTCCSSTAASRRFWTGPARGAERQRSMSAVSW